MKVKDESEKVVLKFNIQKSKIMIFSLTTSWQIYQGKKRNNYGLQTIVGLQQFWAPKLLLTVTADMKLKEACSLEAKL